MHLPDKRQQIKKTELYIGYVYIPEHGWAHVQLQLLENPKIFISHGTASQKYILLMHKQI